jgi:3-oxoacyl-[acyl-carrier protein] reductase
MRLKDKVAIITGGSQGIGREYALRFAREGAKIVIGDIREAQAQEVVQEITDLASEGLALGIDVSKEEDTRRLAAAAHERFGRIDILLNNAAIFYDMELKDQTLEYFNKVLSVNLTGVWLCTRAVEPYMKRQKKGKIINQSSTAAYMGNAGPVDTTCRRRPRITALRRSASRG